jgi:aryl-alcohol dehydrogenase-like predicted oxidoreductase
MTWGERRVGPAQGAYGPSAGRDEEAAALALSVEAGVTLVDTARMYSGGASERRLGELARAHGDAVQIATKYSPYPWQLARSLPAECDASLARLGVDRVTLYQVHFKGMLQTVPAVVTQLAGVARAGKALAVGVSNFSAAQLRLAHRILADAGVPLASNQVQYSLVHRAPETDGVLDTCRELGVTLIAYSPLGMGALTGKYRPGAPRATGVRRFLPAFGRVRLERLEPLLALAAEIGASRGRSIPEVALRWLLEDPVVLPIPGAKDAAQARVNAGALAFELSAAERDALSAASDRAALR